MEPTVITSVTDFADGPRGWIAGFSDYILSLAALNMASGIRPLPGELGLDGTGYYIQGTNTSDDLFMFLTRRFTVQDGIEPNRQYAFAAEIQVASDAPSGAGGVGGAPGESVYLKAGACSSQPFAQIDHEGMVTLNIDKGAQSNGGADAGVAGNIANGRSATEPRQFVLLSRSYAHVKTVSADSAGNLWVIVGTDSGFESFTSLYYKVIKIVLLS